eukprot:jgi/Ulvmu1/5244/UM022_0037.1
MTGRPCPDYSVSLSSTAQVWPSYQGTADGHALKWCLERSQAHMPHQDMSAMTPRRSLQPHQQRIRPLVELVRVTTCPCSMCHPRHHVPSTMLLPMDLLGPHLGLVRKL